MLEVCVTPFSSSSHETFPEKLNCLLYTSPQTSQVLWKAPLAVWHFVLSYQPFQNNPWGTRFCTVTRMYIFIQHENCICLWELPHCPFRERLHGLLSGQEARMHGSSPHFSQMLWITPSLRNPGGFPGCHRYSSVCSGAGCTHNKSRAVTGQAATAF